MTLNKINVNVVGAATLGAEKGELAGVEREKLMNFNEVALYCSCPTLARQFTRSCTNALLFSVSCHNWTASFSDIDASTIAEF